MNPPPLPRIPTAQLQQAPNPRGLDDAPVVGRFGFRSDREVGQFRDDVYIAPYVGEWYDVLSTWLLRIRFDWASHWGKGPPFGEPVDAADLNDSIGYISIEFLNGFIAQYTQPFKVFFDLLNSSSKGKFMWWSSSRLKDQPYDTIRGQQRIVTQAMRAARDPRRRMRFDNSR